MKRNKLTFLIGLCIGGAISLFILTIVLIGGRWMNKRKENFNNPQGIEVLEDKETEIHSNDPEMDSDGSRECNKNEKEDNLSEEDKKETPVEADVDLDENLIEEQTEFAIEEFAVYQDLEMYTYENLQADIDLLQKTYSDLLMVDSLGTTADGRELYHFVIGNPKAEKKLFFNANIHGREYMTGQLLMKQVVTYLQHVKMQDVYEGSAYTDLWDSCAVHVVPMINPDGVTISQFGLDGLQSEVVRKHVESIAIREHGVEEFSYYRRWKSNANGVDLNRNFDALWETYDDGVGLPSADFYKGTSIGCEVESAALIALTEKEMFDAAICYHTKGSVIYWYFGQEGQLYEETKELADLVSKTTGYPTYANYENLDPAGYKDWCIHKLDMPGLTVEIGRDDSPVPPEQFDRVWEENQYVWEEVIRWTLD